MGPGRGAVLQLLRASFTFLVCGNAALSPANSSEGCADRADVGKVASHAKIVKRGTPSNSIGTKVSEPFFVIGNQMFNLMDAFHDSYPDQLQCGLEVEGNLMLLDLEKNEGMISLAANLTYEVTSGKEGIHYVRRTQDVENHHGKCVVIQPPKIQRTHTLTLHSEKAEHLLRRKRDVLSETKYIELALVVDNSLFFRPLNVRIAVVGIEIWSIKNEIAIDKNPNKTLNRFLDWRRQILLPRLQHDNAQLITAGTFEGATLGTTFQSSMCSRDHSGGINVDHLVSVLGISSTIAHNLGHNLGFNHDSKERKCRCDIEPRLGGCIMEPLTGFLPGQTFSNCSIQDLSTSLQHGGGMCLFNVPAPQRLSGWPRCGNLYVEKGEECDCGLLDFRSAGSVCREPFGECDLPEHCNGSSPLCPANVFIQNGNTCQQGEAFCYNGICITSEMQCQALWGPNGTRADDICFSSFNKQGDKYGNCGQRSDGSYIACDDQDVHCGKIQCRGGSNRPLLGSNIEIINMRVRVNKTDIPCRKTYINFGNDVVNHSLVMPGTACGKNKVCNSNENCHCDPGWAPPDCKVAGNGGSLDSGPVLLRKANHRSSVTLLVFFLFILPVAVLCLLLVWHRRRKQKICWGSSAFQKGPSRPQSRTMASDWNNSTREQVLPLRYQWMQNNDIPITPPFHKVSCRPAPPSKPLPPDPVLRSSQPEVPVRPAPPSKPLPPDPVSKDSQMNIHTRPPPPQKPLPSDPPSRPLSGTTLQCEPDMNVVPANGASAGLVPARSVVESVHKLDVIIANKSSYREVFKPENISLRNKLRELCIKLMFLHPVDYGRKAEELLWRKVYYEVIQLIKTNKKHIHSHSTLECAYRTHLIAGVGFYQHLLLYIQSHYQLELQNCIDWTHVTDPLIARYQNELAGVDAELLAERFYHQALSVSPNIGMPFNQLGTLAGSKYYNVEATYYYMRCIQSEVPFDGAYGNLKRLFEKSAKMYHQVKKQELKKLTPAKQSLLESDLTFLCQSVLEDFNLVLFYLPSPSHSSLTTEDDDDHENRYSFVPDLLTFRMMVTCLMVVHNLKRTGSKQYSAAIAFTLALFSHLVNHVNIRLQAELEEGENEVSALHTDNADDRELKDPLILTLEERNMQNGTADEEDGDEDENEGKIGLESNHKGGISDELKKCTKKKYSRLSRLRRRRYTRKEDESDLSEGFDSEGEIGADDENRDLVPGKCSKDTVSPELNLISESVSSRQSGNASTPWDSGSDKSDGADEEEEEEEEEAETAFDVETDSDMNSQESRSDLEDIEEGPKEQTQVDFAEGGLNTVSNANNEQESHMFETSKVNDLTDGRMDGNTSVNGPISALALGSSNNDSSIASNLQAMSSQLFQTKRCFRLAPTFSNVLLRPCNPHSTPVEPVPPSSSKPLNSASSPETATTNGALNCPNENDGGSDSEGSVTSNHSCLNEKAIPERVEILMGQGLLPAVKIFLDWLKANTDIIVMCAQSSQSLWNRLSVLLNLLPDGSKILEADLHLCEEVTDLLSECECPELKQSLLLPEDVALRHLPALRVAHKKLNFEHDQPTLSLLEESIVRLCCIRSFGHFLTRLQGSVLHFNAEAGIFTSVCQSEEDNLVQQARAQFRMLEVSQLEGSLQQPKTQTSMSPYLVPDTTTLCQHLGLIRQLASSGRFIIIIPRTVIDGLDFLKKENAGARDGIRFLESEFRKGNRYIRCQKESGKSFERHKLKRDDIDAWHLHKIIDSCRQLTVSQGNGEEDTAGMVTILTGFQIDEDNFSSLSPHMQVFREDGIISGYRHPRSSALDCVLSSFQMTNETINIWTHFLPTCPAGAPWRTEEGECLLQAEWGRPSWLGRGLGYRALKPSPVGTRGHRQRRPVPNIREPGTSATPGSAGEDFVWHPESCQEDSRHFRHAWAWLEAEAPGAHPGHYLRGRLPPVIGGSREEEGLSWRVRTGGGQEGTRDCGPWTLGESVQEGTGVA
ncbi:SMG5 protein, partial [Polypterus senegalus]